jgi:hypothetical protein
MIQKLKIGDVDAPPNLKTEDVITCCLVRDVHTSRNGDKLVWSNGGMVINRVRPDESKKKPVSVPLRSLHEVTLD